MVILNINSVIGQLIVTGEADLEQVENKVGEILKKAVESVQDADAENGGVVAIRVNKLCEEVQAQDREQVLFSEFKEFVKDWAEGNCTTVEATEALQNFKQELYPETV